MLGFLEDLVTWFVSLVVLVVVTAAFGFGFALIHPGAGVAAGAVAMIIAGCVLSSWRRSIRVNRLVRERYGDHASPQQRALVDKEVRTHEAKQAQMAAYVANQQRQRQQHQMHQRAIHRPFRGR